MSFFRNFIIITLLINLVSARFYNPEAFFAPRYTQTQKNWNVANCGLPSDILDIEYIRITPEVIHAGDEITLEAGGFAKEDVLPGAYAHVQVKLGVVTLLKKNFDICEELSKHEDVELQCPITKGRHDIVQKIKLPKEVPRASFTVHVNAYNYDDEDLACLTLKADFRKN